MGFTFWFIFPLMQDEDETDVKKKKKRRKFTYMEKRS